MQVHPSLLALLAFGTLSGAAQADVAVVNTNGVNVQVYGIADVAVGQVQNSLNVDPQFPASVNPYTAISSTQPGVGTVSGLFNGGISGSRFGIKGDVNAGNGIKGFFTLESGINATTGQLSNAAGALAANSGPTTASATSTSATSSVDGQMFSRQAFVGLSSADLGSLALGRNYAPIFDIVVGYDPVQAAQLFSPLGFSGVYGGGGGVSEDARVDNSLKYANKIGNINFGGLYKFGGNNASSQGNAFGASAGYDNGKYGVQIAYQAFQDAVKGALGTIADQVKVTAYNTSAVFVAGKYKLNDSATLKAGYESYTLSAPSNLLTSASYYGQTVQSVSNFATAAQTTNILFFGGDYNFTPKLNVSAGYYDVSLQQSADATPVQKSGDQTFVSLLADYRFTPMLDSYAGLMSAQYTGNAYATGYITSNQIFAVGARLKF